MVKKKTNVHASVLRTLVYADLFDYPLTLQEMRRFLIVEGVGKAKVDQNFLQIFADYRLISTDGKYYFLKDREALASIRDKREKCSKEKMLLAQKAAEKLAKIPFVEMVGLTGALAMNNAQKDDDIDFFIISHKNTLWLTRALIFFLCLFLRIDRRKYNDQIVKNKICFNLFLDESNLRIEPENLFLAHEICQIKLLFNKDSTYEKFLWENRWVREYLPNAIQNFKFLIFNFKSNSLILNFLNVLNKVAFRLQYHYMKPRVTTEKISLTQAFFHPNNLQEKILNEYEERCQKLLTINC
ncbi:MAG: hypothetical protein M1514_00425, partial [Patescibacteria group bacterium]|nr:hypothetical protein [Patescibacteria group bacterium]